MKLFSLLFFISIFSFAQEIDTINLKEVAKAILEKNPYKVIKDEKNREIPATEQTDFLDVLTFSCNQVGRNFQKIPYPTERNFRGAFRKKFFKAFPSSS